MRVLGIETSCDETGVAVYDTDAGLLAHALHSQVDDAPGVRRGGAGARLPRPRAAGGAAGAARCSAEAGLTLCDLDGIAYTQGPGLAGALLVGASVGSALGYALRIPVLGVHHLEGHLLSPLLATPRPAFPFVALLVSGGHSQLFDVAGVGRYRLLGDTLDDAAGEAFDKTSKLLGLPYPGGPALAALAEQGTAGAVSLPRPMLNSGDLDFSFSGLKTAVLTARAQAGRRRPARHAVRRAQGRHRARIPERDRRRAGGEGACRARERPAAGGWWSRVAWVPTARSGRACRRPRARAARTSSSPTSQFCTDNGAMIALVGALRLAENAPRDYTFAVQPRWDLATLTPQAR